MKDLRNLYNNFLTQQEELNKQAQHLFKSIMLAFFEKNPKIPAIVWQQFTPYFNDGEPCEFSVGVPVFVNTSNLYELNQVKWEEYNGDNDEVIAFTTYSFKQLPEEFKNDIDFGAIEFIDTMIQSNEMKNNLLQLFDDHTHVIATKDGFTVSLFNHD